MKTFWKVSLCLLLVAILGGVGVFVYLTIQGNGGKKEAVELLSAMQDDAWKNLEGFSCEIDYNYTYIEQVDNKTTKEVEKTKIFVSYEDDLKKVAVVKLDKDSKFVSMSYAEYDFSDSDEIYYEKIENFVAGNKLSGTKTKFNTLFYEQEFELNPEIQIQLILDSISNSEIGVDKNIQKKSKVKYNVDLTTNIFTKVKTIEVVGEVYVSSGENKGDYTYKSTTKTKDNLLVSYDNEQVADVDELNMKTTKKLSLSYKYSGGTFNPDSVYNEYAK